MTRHAVLRTTGCAAGLTLVLALAACTGAPPQAYRTSGEVEPPPVEPTALGTDAEEPLPEPEPRPALTTAAAGSGFVDSPDPAWPDNRCMHFAWDVSTGAPDLTGGLAFVVTGAVVDPPTFGVAEAGCVGEQVSCVGATLTGDQPLCEIAFAPVDPAADPGAPVAGLVGHLVCGPDVTDDACASAVTALEVAPDALLPLTDGSGDG